MSLAGVYTDVVPFRILKFWGKSNLLKNAIPKLTGTVFTGVIHNNGSFVKLLGAALYFV